MEGRCDFLIFSIVVLFPMLVLVDFMNLEKLTHESFLLFTDIKRE